MTKLTDLEPRYIRNNEGMSFRCPVCNNEHRIAITWVAPGLYENGFVWSKTGDSFETITITPSIDATTDGWCKFHGWIKNGEVT